ncbi:tetratricopeptide repeat protein [bacterium]|nr:tetratricopeptide repeat protein [bacterium]
MKDKKTLGLVALGITLLVFAGYNYFQLPKSKPVSNEDTASLQTSISSIDGKTMPANHDQLVQADQLREHLKSNPTDTDHWVQLGNLLFDAGNFADAVEPYRTALQLRPTDNDVRTDYAVCLFNTNRSDEAIAELNTVIKSNPNHSTALYNIGVIHSHSGRNDQARTFWNRAIEAAPNSDIAQKARQALANLK